MQETTKLHVKIIVPLYMGITLDYGQRIRVHNLFPLYRGFLERHFYATLYQNLDVQIFIICALSLRFFLSVALALKFML
ncbi:hypothetical protein HMPREF0548_0493 [Lactobacillus ultunensis DSM 16047]|uniref:Uncharacterized protein n=1 Tax=Lactobacillus ultunensis DSM 16047 TaxID=525365 RepID=C2ELE7_9LACO|nr:hypothetical protein HMPREF0548_0493 [Lactobacillus ultunensis DSM 16047]